jgi:hypothetical protein
VERIQSLPSDNLTEDQIVEEREVIERCAEEGSTYHYNSEWPEKVQSSLKEYATICGTESKKISSEYIDSIQIEGNNGGTMKEESEIQNDPFKLDTKGDMSHMEESNWEDVHKQGSLEFRPSMDGGIVPVRGGEDYYENSDPQTARGQNSITEPDAIGALANNEQEDTGERLRRENEERSKQREVNHQDWQEEKLAEMENNEIIPKGSVFATEVMNAQPGLDSDKLHLGVYSDFDLKDMPDKTDGERIAEQNEERRQEIQGAPKEDHEFKPEKNPARGISDSFAEELKKHIK